MHKKKTNYKNSRDELEKAKETNLWVSFCHYHVQFLSNDVFYFFKRINVRIQNLCLHLLRTQGP